MSDRFESDSPENSTESTAKDSSLFVVGIGASAGGLSALEELFDRLPSDSGAAYVVIQHLSPDFKSLMKELLERHTDMEVYRVTQGMELQPNSIYLIPPGKTLIVEANLLRLEERRKDKNDRHEFNFPIDLFFTSLAKNYGEKAIGVILSGTGSDGTYGLRAINEAGGIALVQDPETAEFDGMPRSAISTDVVNHILPIPELAQLIYQCTISPLDLGGAAATKNSLLTYSNLKQITQLLLETENIDFSFYKTTTMSRRIHRRRLINNFTDISSYIDFLRHSLEERQILQSDLLINVTSFFRDRAAWENIENNILPLLIEQAEPNEELRFWVAGCSTGEEAYSLAMLVREALENTDKLLNVKIFATDIDRTALDKASAGVYPKSVAQDIAPERLRKYFILKDNCYQVMRKLREMLIFSPHNLTKDAGFTRMHLISCRNVLIYMQTSLQHYVLRNFHFSLVAQGVLFLGEAESTGMFESEFKSLDKKWKIYQKRRNIRLPLPVRNIPKSTASPLQRSFRPNLASTITSTQEASLLRLLREYDAVILLVSQDNRLLHVYGDSSKFFLPLQGEIVTEVTRMVVLPLQLPLNTALHRARKEKKSIVYTGIKLGESGDLYNISLKVIPPGIQEQDSDFFLVEIKQEAVAPTLEVRQGEEFQVNNEAQQRIIQLEQELQHTRENLQALIEELETTNEEQQASNEELQSTNEELHSVNEELHTVNVEYQTKIQELIQLNNDINNLLYSTDIGVIFLDSDLKIRKFTPAASQAVSLRQSDLERPLKDFRLKIECFDLIELLEKVLVTHQTVEMEVKHKENNHYFLMRIHSYQTEDFKYDGIVISFVKIDEIKTVQNQLEMALVEKNRQLAAIETASDGIALLNNHRFIYLNQAHLDIFGYSQPEELIGQSWQVLYDSDGVTRLEREILPIVKQQGKWQGIVKAKHRDGHLFDEELTLTFTATGDLISVCRDITERIANQRALAASEQKYRYLYKNTPVMLHSIDSEDKIVSVSEYWLQTMGYTQEEVIGKNSTDFLTPESRRYAQEEVIPQFFRTGACQDILYQWVCKDGRIIDGLLSAISEKEQGKIVRSLAVVIDVTDRLKAQQALEASKAELEQQVIQRTRKLAQHSDRLKQLHRLSITSYRDLESLFADYLQTGCQIFELSTGVVSQVDQGIYQIIAVESPLSLEVGHHTSCSHTDCGEAVETISTVAYHQVGAMTCLNNHPVYLDRQLQSFIGTPIFVNGELYGTLNFSDTQARESEFTQQEREIIELMAKDIGQSIASVKAKEALKKSETRFRNTFEQAAVGIAHVSPEGRFLRVNQRLCDIVGYQSDRLISLTFQEITPPDDLAADLEYVRQMLAGEISNYSMEKRYFHRDGSIIWANLTVSLVKNSLGQPDYFISVIEDISDRRRTEIALRENQLSQERLQLVNQAKDAFIAHMSHELRTPLNSILGFSSILQQATKLTDKELKAIDIVHQSGQHLLALINDILDFSKITAKKLQLEPQIFNFYQFLTDIITVFQLRAQQQGLVFLDEISTNLPQAVNTDITRLRQVLYNLLSNAIKFTTIGSVTLKVGRVCEFQAAEETGEIELSNQKIRFQIEDTGIGIPQDKFTDIFAPFGQLKGNIGNQEGTGLGLTISQEIVQLMGSEIQLASQLAVGSKFWFDLKLEEVAADILPASSNPSCQLPYRLRSPRKILIVDDNDTNRTLLVNYLEPLGFVVAEANNGEIGLSVAETFQPDAILLDLVMPVMNGQEMILKIKQRQNLQNAAIVIISASNQSIIDLSNIDDYCQGFLTKPVDLAQLLLLLETHLELDWQLEPDDTKTDKLFTIVAPPQQQLEELLQLVNFGDLEAIEQQINSLETTNAQYTPFARQVRHLLASCQQNKLENMLKNFIE